MSPVLVKGQRDGAGRNRNPVRTLITALRLVVVLEINRNEATPNRLRGGLLSGDDVQRMQLAVLRAIPQPNPHPSLIVSGFNLEE